MVAIVIIAVVTIIAFVLFASYKNKKDEARERRTVDSDITHESSHSSTNVIENQETNTTNNNLPSKISDNLRDVTKIMTFLNVLCGIILLFVGIISLSSSNETTGIILIVVSFVLFILAVIVYCFILLFAQIADDVHEIKEKQQ